MAAWRLNLLCLLGLLILVLASLSIGVAHFSWAQVFEWGGSLQLVWVSRLPRAMALILTGASMAVAGMIMQIVLKNRFVEPSMVGATQSAGLGLLLVSLLAPSWALWAKMGVGALAALLGMLGFMLLARRLPPTQQLLVPLVGIIYGGIIESVAVFIAYEEDVLQLLTVWQAGDFSGVLAGNYEWLWLAGVLALLAYVIADQLTILGLGDTVSVNLGINREAVLVAGLAIVAMMTSLVVVTVGLVPFVGLVVPNIVSRLMGDRLRQSLPAVAILGAVMVLICDMIGRLVVYPFEIPVSTVFGVVGTVLFLYLLMRVPKRGA